ncbi:lipocalin family protein [Winogradskyella ursingii]|uniref:lipocalin family protein n=1 Tax=Winogradskyella ursingii TaxID=2686079 RepID=UPI0015C6D1D4|nr:lipocalin family protein [Winogradskyella ursingii]
MKKLYLLICILVISCSKNPETYLEHLEGYWEIKSVTMPDGKEKDYRFNETIDYISFNDSLKGFRKKLKPGINDTYLTSDDAEALTIKLENDSLNIYYSTPFSNWKETILNATQTELKVVNENNIVYLYERYAPIILDVETD